MSNSNKSLFWYGVQANILKGMGVLLLLFSIIIIIYGLYGGGMYILVGSIVLTTAIVFIAKGSSQRFDYKMRSGALIHKGDW